MLLSLDVFFYQMLPQNAMAIKQKGFFSTFLQLIISN
jgi:hypothetical protein